MHHAGRYNRPIPALRPGGPAPGNWMSRAVGRNVVRKDGAAKAAGLARYVDDLTLPGLLHARTIRSAIPCGDILRLRLGFDTSGFTIVDARDIPGRNVVSLITDDQPCLAEGEVRHVAEPILLLAHEDRERLLAADVDIEYRAREARPRPGAFARGVQAHRDREGRRRRRLPAGRHRDRGRVPDRSPGAPLHRAQRHAGHPRGAGASRWWVRCSARTTCIGRSRCCWAMPEDRVRVVQAETGGGFGGKEEYPVDRRRARVPAGAEVGPAGEAGLRPRRGHARHDQAPPVHRPPPHRRDARRPADGDGHRRADGRRRLLHAQPGRPVARVPARHRARTAATTCASAAASS